MNPAARLLVIFFVAGLVPSIVLGVGLLRGKARRGRRIGSLRPVGIPRADCIRSATWTGSKIPPFIPEQPAQR